MELTTLVPVVAYLAILSVSVERSVQLLKAVSNLKNANKHIIQLVSIIVSLIFAALAPSKEMITIVGNQYAGIFAAGLLASSGSGVWNDILGIVQTYKTNLQNINK